MIIIYPSDPSTQFLKEIVHKIKVLISTEINEAKPNEYPETVEFLRSKSVSETVLFLGHGFSNGLYGGCYVAAGRQVLFNREIANELFRDKKVVLFACRSSELIESMKETFNVAIGFGNIKTAKEDLQDKREKKKYSDHNSLRIFRERLVILFSNSITESIMKEYNFKQFYNSLKLRINKNICLLSLSHEPNERLAGELMFELKRDILLIGNTQAKLTER